MGLKKIWKWMTGRLKKENAWRAAPRILPQKFRDTKPGSDEFSISCEYACTDNPSERRYWSVELPPEGPPWVLKRYDFVLEDVPNDFYASTDCGTCRTPLEAVEALIRKEGLVSRDEKWEKLEQSPPTYRVFAARHGIHFDSDGTPYEINKENTVEKEIFLTHKALVQLFNKKNVAVPVPKDWNSLHAYLESKFPGFVDDTRPDEAYWTAFIEKTAPVLENLQDLAVYLDSPDESHQNKVNVLKTLLDVHADVDNREEKNEQFDRVATFLFDEALLLGVLRAGNELFRLQLSRSLIVEPKIEKLLGSIGKAAGIIAKKRFGATREEVEGIRKIVGLGPDPQGNRLSMTSVMSERTPPLALPAPAAEAESDADVPKKIPPSQRTPNDEYLP
jgi:hypothetical protein